MCRELQMIFLRKQLNYQVKSNHPVTICISLCVYRDEYCPCFSVDWHTEEILNTHFYDYRSAGHGNWASSWRSWSVVKAYKYPSLLASTTVQTYTQNVEDLPHSDDTHLGGVLHAAGGHCRCEDRSSEGTQAVLRVQQLHHQHCDHLFKLLLHTHIGDSNMWSQEEGHHRADWWAHGFLLTNFGAECKLNTHLF